MSRYLGETYHNTHMIYQVPEVEIVEAELQCVMAGGSNDVQAIDDNLGEGLHLNYQGGGSGPARSNGSNLWDDDETWGNK